MLNWFFLLPFQNKEFVYRGQEWEKISTFTQRLASEFPHAQVLTSNSREPDQSLKSEDGQFVQVGTACPGKVYLLFLESAGFSKNYSVKELYRLEPSLTK